MSDKMHRSSVTRLLPFAVVVLILLTRWAAAGLDVAMFRGNPQHSGVYSVRIGAGNDGEPRLKWKFKTDGWVRSSAAIARGIVCIGSDDGNLYGLELASGKLKWKVETSDWVRSSPAIVEGTVYVGSLDGNLYATDLATGQSKWTFQTAGPIYSSPAVDAATIYFGSHDGHLYAVNARDGKLKWKYDAKAPIYSSPAVVYGMVFCGVMSDRLVGVDRGTGEEKCESAQRENRSIPRPLSLMGSFILGARTEFFARSISSLPKKNGASGRSGRSTIPRSLPEIRSFSAARIRMSTHSIY